MNVTKLLLATLVGTIVNFLTGWVLYGMLLMDTMKNGLTAGAQALMKPEGEENLAMYFVSGLFYTLIFAYVFERWAGIRTFTSGAIAGAVISALMALNIDTGFLAGMNFLASTSIIFVDAIAYAIMGALTGGAVGWMLGYNRN